MTPGHCYDRAGKYLLWHEDDGLVLVHGPIHGTISIGHAWLETADGTVIDPSRNPRRPLREPRDTYYRRLQISPVRTLRYDRIEAALLIAKTRHYGPWDEPWIRAGVSAAASGKGRG